MNCQKASQILSQSLDRKLSLRERLSLRLHLTICDACTAFGQHLKLMRMTVKKITGQVEENKNVRISETARQRMASKIDEEARKTS
jgi:hypothetical protein